MTHKPSHWITSSHRVQGRRRKEGERENKRKTQAANPAIPSPLSPSSTEEE
jgi:hypothetical protein